MKKSKMGFLVAVSTAAVLSMTTVFAMPPNLWWDHVDSTAGNQAECVSEAESALRQEVAKLSTQKSGKFKVDEISVRYTNDTTRAVIECMSLPDRQKILIMTSSNEVKVGSKLYEALKKSLQAD